MIGSTMNIAVFCATRRGVRFLARLRELAPDARLVVFSFRETEGEPPFLEDIRALASSAGATFFEAPSLGREGLAAYFRDNPVDLLFAVSWRSLLPRAVYSRSRRGAFVFHDSLLPTYRGFSPTVWALVNGERTHGATLFHMVDEVDAGAIVDQAFVEVGPDETVAEVMERITELYLTMLERNLEALRDGRAPCTPQDERLATYACRRLPEDNRIDWAAPATRIHDLVRAVTRPYAGAYTTLGGRVLRVWSSHRVTPARRFVGAVPGRVIQVCPGQGAVVLTGDGELLVTTVQLEGEAPVSADRLLGSLSITLGR